MCRKKSSGKSDIPVSANMAYGEMKLEPRGGIGGGDGVYEDPDKLVNTTKISRYIYIRYCMYHTRTRVLLLTHAQTVYQALSRLQMGAWTLKMVFTCRRLFSLELLLLAVKIVSGQQGRCSYQTTLLRKLHLYLYTHRRCLS